MYTPKLYTSLRIDNFLIIKSLFLALFDFEVEKYAKNFIEQTNGGQEDHTGIIREIASYVLPVWYLLRHTYYDTTSGAFHTSSYHYHS